MGDEINTQSSSTKVSEDTFLSKKYSAMWDYYKVTLANRKDFIDWYIKIITIPAAVLGLSSSYLSTNNQNIVSLNFVCILFCLISISGVGFLIAYAQESGNSQGYLEDIYYLDSMLNPSKTDSIKVEVDNNNKKSKTRKLSLKLGIAFWRVFPMTVLNSAIFTIGIEISTIGWYKIVIEIMLFIGILFCQFYLYDFNYKKGLRRYKERRNFKLI